MWMVGALAVAVAWCLHALPDQPSVVSPIPPAPAPRPLLAAPVADEPRAAIMKHLRERYDGVDMRYANDSSSLFQLRAGPTCSWQMTPTMLP